jgi:hypothetical protein
MLFPPNYNSTKKFDHNLGFPGQEHLTGRGPLGNASTTNSGVQGWGIREVRCSTVLVCISAVARGGEIVGNGRGRSTVGG